MKTILVCILFINALSVKSFAEESKMGFETELQEGERLLAQESIKFNKPGISMSCSSSTTVQYIYPMEFQVSIKNGSVEINDTFSCFASSGLYCYRDNIINRVSENELTNMIIPSRIAFQEYIGSRHSYDNWSGPQLFHCTDDEKWIEECKWEWYCDPQGLIPDNCKYKKFCYNHIVYTHKCKCIKNCYD